MEQQIDSENQKIQYEGQTITVHIPDCCREGWEDCPHVVRADREKIKRNIGL